MPAWQVIKEQEPAFQKRIREQILTMQKAGESEQHIIDVIQPQIFDPADVAPAACPGRQCGGLYEANMEQTAALQKVSDDACFRFSLPGGEGGGREPDAGAG